MKKFSLLLFFVVSTSILFAQDVYKVVFTTGTTQYYSALVLFSDGTGKMRTKFYRSNSTVMVEQTMKVENTNSGLRITGYKPVYPGTHNTFPNYSPDNFYISQDYRGNLSILNIDDQGTSATASIVLISNNYEKINFLNEFNWRLN